MNNILSILFLAFCFLANAQDLSLNVAVNKNPALMGEKILVEFSIAENAKNFRGPNFKDFRILSGPNPSTSSSYSFVNGKSQSTINTTYSYLLIAKKIGKSMYACYRRWNIHIVPVLKSDALGVAQNVEWMNDILRYIVKEKFASTKEVPYSRVIRDCCPGQTTQSVSKFLNDLKRCGKDTQLHELCKKRLSNPSPNSYLGNDEMAQEHLQYACEIVKLKQTLISNKPQSNVNDINLLFGV